MFLPDYKRVEFRRQCGVEFLSMAQQFGQAVDKIERDKLGKARGPGWKMVINIAFSVVSRGMGAAALPWLEKVRPLGFQKRHTATAHQ